MKRLLFIVICYFAGQGATSIPEELTLLHHRTSRPLTIQEPIDFSKSSSPLVKRLLLRRSSQKSLSNVTSSHPILERRSRRGSPASRGSPSPTSSRAGSGELSPLHSPRNSMLRAGSGELSQHQSPRRSASGGSPRLIIGNTRPMGLPPRGSPTGRSILGIRPPQRILGTSPKRISSVSSLAGSSQGRLSRSSFGSLDSLAELPGEGPLAEGKVIGKGPATLRAQEGANLAMQPKLRAGEAGSLNPSHGDHIRIGGTAGRSRSPSPDPRGNNEPRRSRSPGREPSKVVGYAKGDLVHVETDLTKGGAACIEDCGGVGTHYKSASFQKIFPPSGQKSTYLFKGTVNDQLPAHIRTEIKEPASFDVLAKMIPPGENRATWLTDI